MRRLFERHGYSICVCEQCRHQATHLVPVSDHVARVYDDQYFYGRGAGYADYRNEGRFLRNYGRRYAKLLARS